VPGFTQDHFIFHTNDYFPAKMEALYRRGQTLKIFEHAAISQTLKFLESILSPDLTSHNPMSPTEVPTEVSNHQFP
jgi:hypothetical protein